MDLAIWMERREVDAFWSAKVEEIRVVVVKSRILSSDARCEGRSGQ